EAVGDRLPLARERIDLRERGVDRAPVGVRELLHVRELPLKLLPGDGDLLHLLVDLRNQLRDRRRVDDDLRSAEPGEAGQSRELRLGARALCRSNDEAYREDRQQPGVARSET